MKGSQTILHDEAHPALDEAALELLKPLEQLANELSNIPVNEETVQIKVSELSKLQLHSSILAKIIKLTEGNK